MLGDSIVKNKTSVVVVIPFYNGSKWIERAAKSVSEQTISPDEFIVVNDGSNDAEREALTPMASQYGFRIIDKQNGGQGSARNAGVWASTSEYISFLDQDDYYLPHHIEDLVEALPSNDRRLGFVYADLCEGDEEGRIVHSNLLHQIKHVSHPKKGHIGELIRNDLFILPSASLIKRSAFEEVGGFDPQFMGYEDDDLFLRMFRSGFTNYFIDKPVTVWCTHTGSTSWSIKMSRSRYKYFRKLTENYPDDVHKAQFFMRDSIAPRFEPDFVREAIHASRKKPEHAKEYIDILAGFVGIVTANDAVDDEFKRHLRRSLSVARGEEISVEDYGKFQRSLYDCYRSTSWKISSPLRLAAKTLTGKRFIRDSIPSDESEAMDRFIRLRRSVSWRLTAPVRFAKRAIKNV